MNWILEGRFHDVIHYNISVTVKELKKDMKILSGYPISGARCKPGISRIRSNNYLPLYYNSQRQRIKKCENVDGIGSSGVIFRVHNHGSNRSPHL
jgi:hypothetical protein